MLKTSTDKTDSPKGLLANLLSPRGQGKEDKFSLLLKSFSFGKTEGKNLSKELENTILMTHTGEKSSLKKEVGPMALLKLFALGKEDAKDEELIHSDLIKTFPNKNIQQLIGEAKAFLKEQISQKVDIKELPNTLGGLIKLAEKSGIDVRAISFESLSQSPFKEELLQAQNPLPHSTSELVKPAIAAKKEASAVQHPLNALLSSENTGEALLANASPKTEKASAFGSALSALLHGEKKEEPLASEGGSGLEGDKSSDKAQALSQSKTEPLTQKIVESKQLIQHMAQNIKESMENYRPPFTKITMQLNPQKFGEMEVTLVQRGNNVHINISANTTALTVMMQNAHELKAQLSTHGLGDASMNFSSHQQQQENHHRRENAHSAYEKFQEYEDEFTEVATALEIIVPRYI